VAAKGRRIEDVDRVLVVGGYSDLLFYAEVLEEVEKDREVFIKELGGNSDLKNKLEAFITPSLLEEKTALAFIFDPDEEPDETRDSREKLLSLLSEQTVVDGHWTQGKPKVGLFIVPGGDAKGEVETLVWNSW